MFIALAHGLNRSNKQVCGWLIITVYQLYLSEMFVS